MSFAQVKKLKKAFKGAVQEFSRILSTPSPLTWEGERDLLFKAAARNDVETIKQIAPKYPNEFMKWTTKKGSPLRVAQREGNLGAFKELVAFGADVNENYGDGWTPLLVAVEYEQKALVDFLLDKGANVVNAKGTTVYMGPGDSPNGGYGWTFTPLHLAIANHDADTVKKLLERGADPEKTGTPEGPVGSMTAGAYAMYLKQYTIVDILKRADVLRTEYLAKQAYSAPGQQPSVQIAPPSL